MPNDSHSLANDDNLCARLAGCFRVLALVETSLLSKLLLQLQDRMGELLVAGCDNLGKQDASQPRNSTPRAFHPPNPRNPPMRFSCSCFLVRPSVRSMRDPT